jgi:hypothetical protein
VNLMRLSSELFSGVCVFLVIILVVAGCTGTGKPAQDPNCTRPTLLFNDSQEITRIYEIAYTSPFESPKERLGTVPLGGVVYRSPGFTRIFDSTGKQILFVNDTESIQATPAGYQTAACVHSYIPNMRFVAEGENIENIYVEGYDTCIVSIINKGGSCLPSNIPNF